MRTLQVHEKTDKEGVLRLRIPTGVPNADVEAVIVLQPQERPSTPNDTAERGWPPGYFDLAGSITDATFMRQPQGDLPKPIRVD